MHILNSRRTRDKYAEELRLVRVAEIPDFDIFAVLAKTLIVFMIVYGAMGGFLSAYEIEYNKSLCMFAIFFLSLLFGAVYETRKKWASNLLIISVFLLYVFFAMRSFWVINSGCYAVLNKVFEVARDYLDILNGMEYTLVVEDEYAAVTGFGLFIGIVGTILLNIQFRYKANLFRILLITLPVYLLPLYFEKSPDTIYVLFLLTGYVTVAILHGGVERLGSQMRYMLPVAAVIVVVFLRLTPLVLPERRYDSFLKINPYKKATEEQMANFAKFGLRAFFTRTGTGAGIGGGVLGKGAAVMPDYKTDLLVRFTPYSYQPVYLKAFTGKDYTGEKWTRAGEAMPGDGRMEASVLARADIEEPLEDAGFAEGVMEVENVDASRVYEYRPYYTDFTSVEEKAQTKVYHYYPPVGQQISVEKDVDENYLTVPGSCRKAVQRVCEEAGFSGTPEEIARQVVDFFKENFSYTLRPGWQYGRSDYITYFLMRSKKGYCVHFASAGTMLFRNMGIPARYVEGYVFSYADILDSGKLVEDADYDDYYKGYSPMGKTGVIEVAIPDANAHSWVEIYIDGQGWVVVDPTPSSTKDDDDAVSFWDAFFRMDEEREDQDFGFGENNVGDYLEKGISRIASGALILGAGVLVFFMVRWTIRRRREANLSERERVRLEYRRMTDRIGKKYKDFALLRTIREQMAWIGQSYGMEISGDLTERLYAAFFAGDAVNAEWDEVRRDILKLGRGTRLRRRKQG